MISALLIDDEPAANRALENLLKKGGHPIIVKGVAMSIASGLQKIDDLNPDLLFLDINLPDGRGFDLVRRLPDDSRPEIIFVTSEENYAMQAIKVAALGYLLKPVDPQELAAAVELAKTRIRQKNSEQRLRALMDNLKDSNHATKQISIPSEKGVEFVTAGNIVYCKGVDGYTHIQLIKEGSRLSSYSIGEYRKMLESYGFFAVHRSYLVNRLHVNGWVDSGTLKLKNHETVSVSRRRKAAVAAWLND